MCCRMMSRQTCISRVKCSGSFSISIRTENPRTALSVSARTSLASCLRNPGRYQRIKPGRFDRKAGLPGELLGFALELARALVAHRDRELDEEVVAEEEVLRVLDDALRSDRRCVPGQIARGAYSA